VTGPRSRVVGLALWLGAAAAAAVCGALGYDAFQRLRTDLAGRYHDQQAVIAREVALLTHARVAEWWPYLDAVEHGLCREGRTPGIDAEGLLLAAVAAAQRGAPRPTLLLAEDGRALAGAGVPPEVAFDALRVAQAGDLPSGLRLGELPEAMMVGPLAGGVSASLPLPGGCNAFGATELSVLLPLDDLIGEPMAELAAVEGTSAWVQNGAGRILYHSADPDQVGRDAYVSDKRCAHCHYPSGALRPEGRSEPSEQDSLMASAPLGDSLPDWRILVTTPRQTIAEELDEGVADLVRLLGVGALFMLGAALVTALVWRRGAATTRRALELHRDERRRLDHILSGLGAGVLAVEDDMRIVWANRVAIDWFGPGAELMGTRCHDVLHCSGSPCPECPTRRELASERPLHTRHTIKTRDGRLRAFSVTAAPVLGADGAVSQVLHVLQDVTELVDLEQQVARTERLAALGRLAAGVAHEVGNPLTSMSSFIQILREQEQAEFTRRSLDKMSGQVERIAATVRKLSDLSRADEAVLRPVQVDASIRSAVEMVEFDRRLSNIDTELCLDGETPHVTADPQQLQQVFINLLLNAVDAMEEGGRLEIGARRDARDAEGGRGYVVAWVQDSGTGIPVEVRSRVFDPFFTTKEVGKGTGLGLSISYSIIRSFGGRIELESDTGEGTRASVWLPVAPAQEAA